MGRKDQPSNLWNRQCPLLSCKYRHSAHKLQKYNRHLLSEFLQNAPRFSCSLYLATNFRLCLHIFGLHKSEVMLLRLRSAVLPVVAPGFERFLITCSSHFAFSIIWPMAPSLKLIPDFGICRKNQNPGNTKSAIS